MQSPHLPETEAQIRPRCHCAAKNMPDASRGNMIIRNSLRVNAGHQVS